ncbi:MAG: GspH/FimT family protein [Gammaproteobacteria bacterium]|nr:GspH/FimT family protein [Gammaproteobacteria bacterium]MCF6231089.1 GspH/FimT family protein [Gammaproteobacteria bacterium]
MSKERGITLTELVIVIGIIAVIAAASAPAFSHIIDKQRLQGAADSFYADLQLTRSEAIKRHAPITLSVTLSEDRSWCYAQSDSGHCNCTVVAECSLDNIPSRVTSSTRFKEVTLTSTFANHAVTFSGTRGGTRAGRYVLTNSGITYQIVVDALGFPDLIKQ